MPGALPELIYGAAASRCPCSQGITGRVTDAAQYGEVACGRIASAADKREGKSNEGVDVGRAPLLRERLAGLALREHGAGNSEHGEAPVGHLGVELLRAHLRVLVLGAEEAAAVVTRVVVRRPPRDLDETGEEEDLCEAQRRDLVCVCALQWGEG